MASASRSGSGPRVRCRVGVVADPVAVAVLLLVLVQRERVRRVGRPVAVVVGIALVAFRRRRRCSSGRGWRRWGGWALPSDPTVPVAVGLELDRADVAAGAQAARGRPRWSIAGGGQPACDRVDCGARVGGGQWVIVRPPLAASAPSWGSVFCLSFVTVPQAEAASAVVKVEALGNDPHSLSG